MTENTTMQRLFGGCGCGDDFLVPLLIIGAVLLFGDELADIKIINGETRYYTKGDANEDLDAGYITDSNITGYL